MRHAIALFSLLVTAPLLVARTAPAEERERVTRRPEPTHQIFFLDAEGGVQQVDLRTFTANPDTFAAGLVPTVAVGPSVGVGGGIRVVFLTLGLRGRYASFGGDPQVGAWSLSTVDGEVGFRVPLGRLEPYLSFAGGYAWIGGLGTAVPGVPGALDVNGYDGRFGGGLDYWVAKNLSLGVRGSFDVLLLSRPGVPVDELGRAVNAGTLNEAKASVLRANGSSAGTGLGLTGGLALHF